MRNEIEERLHAAWVAVTTRGRRRHITAEEARMFDEALMASVEIIDPGIHQDQE